MYSSILLLAHLYRGIKGDNIDTLMEVLKIAGDLLTTLTTAAGSSVEISACHVREAAYAIEHATRSPTATFTYYCPDSCNNIEQSTAIAAVTAALKQLQEDLAVLRRVNRIPDSRGVNAKALLKLKSGGHLNIKL